jgi:hypothetical protein
VLTAQTAARYCVGDSAASWATRTHVILDLHSEDVGGAGGYQHLLAAYADPAHPDHGDALDTLGSDFDLHRYPA